MNDKIEIDMDFVARPYSAELYHYALKHANKDFKYIRKEMKNGKMRYYYDTDAPKGTLKTAARDPVKNTSIPSNTSKLRNPATSKTMAVNKDDRNGVTSSTAKKQEASTKSEPWVSDEYKKEMEYNSKKNSFTNDTNNETSSSKKKTEPSTTKKQEQSTKSEPWVSDEYKKEMEYNSKKNSFSNDTNNETKDSSTKSTSDTKKNTTSNNKDFYNPRKDPNSLYNFFDKAHASKEKDIYEFLNDSDKVSIAQARGGVSVAAYEYDMAADNRTREDIYNTKVQPALDEFHKVYDRLYEKYKVKIWISRFFG